MIRYVLAWLPMLVIAIANGAFRQLTFAKVMPEVHAHQLSTVTGSVLIGVFIWFVIGTWPPSSAGQAPLIGVIWLVLTVGFELFMGLVLTHKSLSQVLHDYNILEDRVWVLFLIELGIQPRPDRSRSPGAKALTTREKFPILRILVLNNTRHASAGYGRKSAPRRVTHFEGALRAIR